MVPATVPGSTVPLRLTRYPVTPTASVLAVQARLAVVPATEAVRLTGVEGAVVSPGGGVTGPVTVQPDSPATVTVRDPSFTSTVQSAGGVNGSRSIRKAPEPSLRPRTMPSTVMSREGKAVPSRRSRVPLTSARVTVATAKARSASTTMNITVARTSHLAVFPIVKPPPRFVVSMCLRSSWTANAGLLLVVIVSPCPGQTPGCGPLRWSAIVQEQRLNSPRFMQLGDGTFVVRRPAGWRC